MGPVLSILVTSIVFDDVFPRLSYATKVYVPFVCAAYVPVPFVNGTNSPFTLIQFNPDCKSNAFAVKITSLLVKSVKLPVTDKSGPVISTFTAL